ncbi:O-antigen ligase family protein [Methylorubrum aminovorans]|nr:O-antigen ligase [Methylorubrum aminovorans]GMA76014.1 ligase [Methylorubrum aminovorans]
MTTASIASQGRDTVQRAVLFLGSLMVFWITLDPLSDLSRPPGDLSSGDLLNQVLYVALYCLTMAKLIDLGWRGARPLLHPAYLLLLAWFAVSAVLGVNPGTSVRRLVLCAMVMSIVGVLPILPRTQRDLELWLGTAAMIVVVLCYLAVLLVPALSVHQADAPREAGLAGDWRGIYDHKSTAGPMMIVFLFIGAFLAGQGRHLFGGVLFVLSLVFLLFTGTKQPTALMPVILLVSRLALRTRSRLLFLALCLGALALYNLMTVGSAVIPSVSDIVAKLISDPTFTNRTGIWNFAIDRFLERPLTGYGFMGFWSTDAVLQSDPLGQLAWTAEATDSHNSYLDLALTTGFPGLCLALWVVVLMPLLDFMRARLDPTKRGLALLFFRIWLFCIFVAALETVFFLRDSAVWVSFLIAIFGLRYLACYPVRP